MDAELPIALTFDAAKQALERALADGGLAADSRRAIDDGLDICCANRARGLRACREVTGRLLPGRREGKGLVVPPRWEVTGPTGALFPALDANLELVAVDAATSRVSVIGRYEPPLGRPGATIDRAGLSRVASDTLTALLRELATQLRHWA